MTHADKRDFIWRQSWALSPTSEGDRQREPEQNRPAGRPGAGNDLRVLINLAFIYPDADADDGGDVADFSKLAQGWQLVVIAVTIVVLGYLLLNSATSVVDTLAGQRLAVQDALTAWPSMQRDQLKTRRDEAGRRQEQDRPSLAASDLFPTQGARPADPSWQHDCRRAAPVRSRHGIELTALWPQMESTPAVKDSPALVAIADEKATVDLFANLIFVLVLFAFEGLVRQ